MYGSSREGRLRRRGRGSGGEKKAGDVRRKKDPPPLGIKLCVRALPIPRLVLRGGMSAAVAAAAAVSGRELDAVDSAADAVDVVERVGEGGVVRVEREVDVADDEARVVPASCARSGREA